MKLEQPEGRIVQRFEETPTTNRGLDSYLADLNLQIDALKKLKILDVGAGLRKFACDGFKEGLDIYSLEPKFQDRSRFFNDWERTMVDQNLQGLSEENKKALETKTITSTIENNGIPDESFDLIVANASIPLYSHDIKHIGIFFHECLRILKPGGEIRITPCGEFPDGSILVPCRIFDCRDPKIVEQELKDVVNSIKNEKGVTVKLDKHSILIISKSKQSNI